MYLAEPSKNTRVISLSLALLYLLYFYDCSMLLYLEYLSWIIFEKVLSSIKTQFTSTLLGCHLDSQKSKSCLQLLHLLRPKPTQPISLTMIWSPTTCTTLLPTRTWPICALRISQSLSLIIPQPILQMLKIPKGKARLFLSASSKSKSQNSSRKSS